MRYMYRRTEFSTLQSCGVPNLSKFRQAPELVALGSVIYRRRVELGFSQEKLALIAEIERSHVGRVERGDNNVTVLVLVKLAKALNMSVEDLMREAQL